MTRTQKFTIAALLFSAVSILINFYLASNHYDLLFGVSEEKSICNINSTFNCDLVDASPYSKLFGIPLGVLGGITNFVILLYLVFAYFNEEETQERWLRASLYLTLFSVTMSVIMGTISIFQVHAVCLFCISLYVLSILLLACTWAAFNKGSKKFDGPTFAAFFQGGENGLRRGLILLLAIPLVSYLCHSMMLSSRESLVVGNSGLKFDSASYVTQWKLAPQYNFDGVDGLTLGASPEKAKMTIVEFADFLCPHCKHAAPALHTFALAHPDDVRFVFLSFPLDGQCNGAMPPHDGVRCDLAKAVYCAKFQDKGWDMHEWAFEKYTQGTEVISSAIQSVGVDKEKFEACMKDTNTHQAILDQAAKGKAAQVPGTPSVFVNGRSVPPGPWRVILEAIHAQITNPAN